MAAPRRVFWGVRAAWRPLRGGLGSQAGASGAAAGAEEEAEADDAPADGASDASRGCGKETQTGCFR